MNLFKHSIVIILLVLLSISAAQAAYAVNITNVSNTALSTAASTNATYIFNMTNNGTSGTDSYSLTIQNPNSASVAGINISTPVILDQNATQYFELNVTNTASGTFYINVTAVSVNDTTKYFYMNTTTTVTAVRAVNFSNITAVSGASTKAGTNYSYTLIITNNGSDPDSYNVTIDNSESFASVTGVNISSFIYLTAGANRYISFNITNTTANVSGLVFKVNLTAVSNNDTTKYGWVNTSTSIYDQPSITASSPSTPITDTWGIISRTFSVTVNQSATVTYYLNGTNVGSATGTTVTYTNSTASVGTWNITASATTTEGVASQTWTWEVPASTISSLAVVTNLSSSDRAKTGSNSSINFTWTDTGNITTINVTFPGRAFGFYNIIASNVTSNIGDCTIYKFTSEIGCHNATGTNNTVVHINFTVNVTVPPTSGTYPINIKTNKNLTGMNVSLYARDAAKPFYIKSNNSAFTVGTETFGTLTTTLPLTGSGIANLTFWVPYIGGQANITAGWGATNATVIKSNSTTNTSYVETNPSVTDPIVVLSAEGEFESSNLPTAITAAGVISGLTIVYAYLRRRRRHP